MSHDPPGDASEPVRPLDADLDRLCDQFKRDWRNGQQPRIEDYLARRSTEDKTELLKELLLIELELRRQAGDSPTIIHYRARFPGQAELVGAVFGEADTVDRIDGVSETVDLPPHRSHALKIRCPHCHQTVEIVDDQAISSITCSSCQRVFSLAAELGISATCAGKTLGHFQLIEQLGAGAFGAVWKARDTQLDRLVAVKIPRRNQFDAADVEKFIREARAAAQLKHPNIVSVHEVGREGDTVYIVSDYIAGLSLDKWLESRKYTPRDGAALCQKIALALHHAHEVGVVHRDLKPSNIMIDPSGEPHIMDFGLAKRDTNEITMTAEGQILGTPAYMSPEQAKGEGHAADGRSDVYSIGVILFELLTGERPFRGDLRALLKQVMEAEPPSPRKFNHAISRDLETICLQCLEKDPSRRYATAAHLADELDRFQRGDAILSRPLPGWMRLARKARRNAARIAVLIVLLVVGIVAVGLARSSIRLRATNVLEQDVEAAVEKSDWSQEHLESIDSQLTELTALDAAKAKQVHALVTRGFSQSLTARIHQSHISETDVEEIKKALSRLQAWDLRASKRLEAELEKRRRAWQPAVTRTAPVPLADWQSLFSPESVTTDQAGRCVFNVDSNYYFPVLTTHISRGRIEVSAEFDDWQQLRWLGIAIDAEKGRGYAYLLSTKSYSEIRSWNSEDPLPTFEDVEKAAGTVYLEVIGGDGRLLRSSSIDIRLLQGSQVRMRARRQGDRLELQVNETLPMVIFDLFPPRDSRTGVVGVFAHRGATLSSLHILRQAQASVPSVLEKGDEVYTSGEFDQALLFYRNAGAEATQLNVQAEALFKQALCLLALRRMSDAQKALEQGAGIGNQIAESANRRWCTLADCQLLALYLESGMTQEADAQLEKLVAVDRLSHDQLLQYLPMSLQEQLLAMFASTPVSRVFGPTELVVARLERAYKVQKLFGGLDKGGVARSIHIDLARAYRQVGRRREALAILRQLLKDHPQYPLFASETCWLLRELDLNDEALALAEQCLRDAPIAMHALHIERARTLTVQGKSDEAEKVLVDYLVRAAEIRRDPSKFQYANYSYHSSACLLLGILREQRGDLTAARAAWQQGLLRNFSFIGPRPNFQFNSIVNNWIMSSLLDGSAGEETPALFLDLIGDDAGSPQLRTLADGLHIRPEVWNDTWSSTRGRAWARHIAIRDLSYSESIDAPPQLLALEIFRHGAFAGAMTQQQEEALWQLVKQMHATFQQQQIAIPNLLQLAIVWKGLPHTFGFGWKEATAKQTPSFRSGLAWLMAHRYLQLGKQEQALEFLTQATEEVSQEAVWHDLAEDDLQTLTTMPSSPP